MTARNQGYERGHADGLRAAVAWLHKRANEMNDPHAKAILNGAAFNLGLNNKRGPALSCPDGFRLVPVEPDLGMYRALTARLRETDAGKDFAIKWSLGSFREDYQAMLAASPAPAE